VEGLDGVAIGKLENASLDWEPMTMKPHAILSVLLVLWGSQLSTKRDNRQNATDNFLTKETATIWLLFAVQDGLFLLQEEPVHRGDAGTVQFASTIFPHPWAPINAPRMAGNSV